MHRREAVEIISSSVSDAHVGLPEDVFLLVSTITPLVNVDLLIRNEAGAVLLTWRDDRYSGPGWHVPGGIVRYKERLEDRIQAVAVSEVGATVTSNPAPLAVNEILISDRRERGHFISMLYECSLIGFPRANMRHVGGTPQSGHWQWFDHCPRDLIESHEIYRGFF